MNVKFSIVKKMVLGITAVSIITYGTSAFFIFVLQDWFKDYIPEWIFVLGTLALGIFWTGFLGWIAARWFIQPLIQLTNAANQASTGNLQIEISPSKSDDELRALGLSFGTMINNIREILAGISANSTATDTHVEQLQSAIGQAARHVESITITIDEISQGAELQSKSSETMFESVEHMTKSTHDINDKSEIASKLTNRMIATIAESAEVIHSLVEGMYKLAHSNQESMDVVRRLQTNAKQISDISSVVGEFAAQTHLLALNASIEAARSGEHGRGFAVVADEVKKLAEQSAHAANDINQLILKIQAEVTNVVQQISEQYEVADRESKHGEATSQAMQRITEEAELVGQTISDIASMVSSQAIHVQSTLKEAQGVAEIAGKIHNGSKEVFSSTQEQTAVMQEIAASSDVLRDQSANLRRQIGIFKVK